MSNLPEVPQQVVTDRTSAQSALTSKFELFKDLVASHFPEIGFQSQLKGYMVQFCCVLKRLWVKFLFKDLCIISIL